MGVGTVRVLLVVAGARNAPMLQDHLKKRGCDVFFATSHKEAAEMLKAHQFDLALSEFMLSDGAAFQLMPLLRGTATTIFFPTQWKTVTRGCWPFTKGRAAGENQACDQRS